MLHEVIDSIKSKEDLADFIAALRGDLENNEAEWENPTLDRFLLAMEEWVRSMELFYQNTGREVPIVSSWKVFADMLYAARIYE